MHQCAKEASSQGTKSHRAYFWFWQGWISSRLVHLDTRPSRTPRFPFSVPCRKTDRAWLFPGFSNKVLATCHHWPLSRRPVRADSPLLPPSLLLPGWAQGAVDSKHFNFWQKPWMLSFRPILLSVGYEFCMPSRMYLVLQATVLVYF